MLLRTRQGKTIHLLTQSDLDDVLASGERLRAGCPIHGSDHQRSLSIDCTTGWGYCHCCHATVLVEDRSPEIAARLKRNARIQSQDCSPPLDKPIHRASPNQEPATFAPLSWQCHEVAALFSILPAMQAALATSRRVQRYLAARCIPLPLAQATGVAYLTRATWEATRATPHNEFLKRWVGRLIFPLGSPAGWGFIGRSLWYWETGMDENQHKAMLEEKHVRRWIKTNPAGWFSTHPAQFAQTLVLVEGGFDRLALLAAGVPAHQVIALVGTAARPAWIATCAPQVKRLILALDADSGGQDATERLAHAFREVGLAVQLASPPQDEKGKDWSERYRCHGASGVWPLLDAISHHHE